MFLARRRLLFAKDFKRHMEAADIILRQLGDVPKEAMSCMDLLLRWLVLRMCDANTQCLLKVLDLTKALFTLMVDQVRPPGHTQTHRKQAEATVWGMSEPIQHWSNYQAGLPWVDAARKPLQRRWPKREESLAGGGSNSIED